MKRIVILPLLLAGCAHKVQPAIEVRTVEVPVIRVEKCIALADIPKVPADLPKRPPGISAALDIAVAKVLELQTYVSKADPLLKGCAAS